MQKFYLSYFAWLLCFTSQIVVAQEMTEMVVAQGKEYLLKEELIVDKLIVKGTFRVSNKNDVKLAVSQLVIDGGNFVIGSTETPFEKRATILLGTKAPKIHVLNGGSINIHGTFQGVHPKTLRDVSRFDATKDCTTNIALLCDSMNPGSIKIENTDQVHISGVTFRGFGSNDMPAVAIGGGYENHGFIESCLFMESKGTDLQLTGSGWRVENNLFLSGKGPSIICSSSKGYDNILKGNTVVNFSNNGRFAVVLNSPYQTFRGNRIFAREKTNGIWYASKNKMSNAKSLDQNSRVAFEDNTLVNYTDTGQKKYPIPSTVGLKMDDFTDSRIWTLSGNTISGFGTGGVFGKRNLLVKAFRFMDNTIGCLPGTAYLQDSSFEFSELNTNEESVAVLATDSLGTAAPKISNVAINGYGVGVHFRGKVSANNYFEKIEFEGAKKVSFERLDKTSVINDKDGSLFKKEDKGQMPHHQHEGHGAMASHGHGHGKKKVKGFLLHSEESFLRTQESELVDVENMIYRTPKGKVGSLVVSTGFGLPDPVHEHHGQLKEIGLRHANNSKMLKKEIASDHHTFLLTTNQTYELLLGPQEQELYDFSLEWEAIETESIVLKIPYQHEKVAVIRSFGGLVASVPNLEILEKSKESTYYWDSGNKTVHIKLVPQKNMDALVVYSPNVLTELRSDGKRIPVSMKTDEKANRIAFTYKLPISQPSKLELLDYYGNTVETLFEGFSSGNTNTVFIDLAKHDVQNQVFRYALTVNGRVHRGPVHRY